MGLTRSDSSSSQWFSSPALPTTGQQADGELHHIRDQRRLRHLSSILIRNLTLNPRRDHLSSLLHSPNPLPPTTNRAQDDTDLLLLRSSNKRRNRASSTASSIGSFNSGGGGGGAGSRAIPPEWRRELERDEDAGSGSGSSVVYGAGGETTSIRSSRTRPRRASAASIIIREEVEPPSPSSAPGFAPPPPATEDDPQPQPPPHHLISSIPSFRKRSASRASTTSAGTSASTSTIRQTPHLDLDPDLDEGGSFSPHPITPRLPSTPTPPPTGPRPFHAASSEAQLAREKARREEILRRRLVDSFISIELVPTSSSSTDDDDDRPTPRRRAPTLGSGAGGRGRMVRSDSASAVGAGVGLGVGVGVGVGGSGWTSPKKRPARSRTLSSPVTPSTSSPAEPTPTQTTSTPFFISKPASKTMHPTFVIDRNGFVLPPPLSPSSSFAPTPPSPPSASAEPDAETLPTFDDEDLLQHWEGLREGRMLVKVWTRGGGGEKEVDLPAKGKGKEREEEGWRLLLEWDVEMDGLISLGRDPTHFPPLPPNTLIFQLETTDEYFTAPLSSRRRPRSRSHRLGGNLGSLSDGDASSEGSCESDEEEVEGEEGNMSDPGAGGTLTLRRRRGMARGETLVRRRELEAEEERRRRRALVEKSVRETRMVRLAPVGEVEKLLLLEREVERVRKEVGEVKRRVGESMFPSEGEGVETLEREKEEMRDKIEDLEAVREQMREELGEAREDLVKRREALDARRERLRAAKALDERRREELKEQRKEVIEDETTCSSIRLSSRTRRTQLITLLSHIFPIDPYEPPASSSSASSSPLLFSILSHPLPNSTYPPTLLSSETLSSALGYTAQVVSTLAAYLGVPLHYPIKCLGSRSAVVDLISMMRGPRAFPLYPKGVDRYRFDYAVFLLNKNIEQVSLGRRRKRRRREREGNELTPSPPSFLPFASPHSQLMYSQGLTVIDLRNTLPNLKSLILALSYDPSHS
ncbi:UV radiation resistance protein and autophagy-related subunit 14-domain-containing protein [Leucosporidium creatinivorum]|uniref:Autophagy-related protein 14 n=1 Tax=Leucosporidium creatinivorum TaxID=106004 RepID=A0A1Y2FYH8_9BASI|nr:UV radiation resistance protein and autophagy-related subunit 14-domain-containing protein [Leucosporidium creatinivorum]